MDVINSSLGIEIEGGVYQPLIERFSTVPACAKRLFKTVAAGQSAVEIHVRCGEVRKAPQNPSLGRFLLSGIQALPGGESRIAVTFKVGFDCLLHVEAEDLGSGLKQSVIFSITDLVANHRLLRLGTLVTRVRSLTCELDGSLENTFQQEIEEIIADVSPRLPANRVVECQIALGTIVGELEALRVSQEVYGEPV